MTALYQFAVLDARPGVRNPVLDTPCLGIEVTVQALADRCMRGNVDPQHGCHHPHPGLPLPEGWPYGAIEHCARFGFSIEDGTTLVTVRPDTDSIGAMSVMVLRRLGLYKATLGPRGEGPVWDRIALISARDAFTPGAAWTPRPLPTVAQPWPTTAAPVGETESLAPLGVICSPAPGQRDHMLADRVFLAACWLLWGLPKEATWGDVETACRIAEACGANGALTSVEPRHWAWCLLDDAASVAVATRLALALAVESGEIKIRVALPDGYPASGAYIPVPADGLYSPHDAEVEFSHLGVRALLAVVESAHRGALGLGYCEAPVVVAAMPPEKDGSRKVTIAAWRPGLVDFDALKARLNAAERAAEDECMVHGGTWGGGATILGSPQGTGTMLPIAEIVAAVRAAMA